MRLLDRWRVRRRLALGQPGPRLAVPVPGRVRVALAAADVSPPAEVIVLSWCGCLLVGGAVSSTAGGPVLAAVVAVASAAAPVVLLRLAAERGARRHEAGVPVALEAVARALRSGAPLEQAVREAAAACGDGVGDELARVASAAARGVPLADAVDGWARRRPLPAVRLAASALAVAAEAGGRAARAIDGTAATVRSALEVAAETRALAAQARYSALVIAAAPLVFGALGSAADGRQAAFLLRSPLGQLCLVVALALDAVAVWWMHRLVTPR